jgi:hypothetical protein
MAPRDELGGRRPRWPRIATTQPGTGKYAGQALAAASWRGLPWRPSATTAEDRNGGIQTYWVDEATGAAVATAAEDRNNFHQLAQMKDARVAAAGFGGRGSQRRQMTLPKFGRTAPVAACSGRRGSQQLAADRHEVISDRGGCRQRWRPRIATDRPDRGSRIACRVAAAGYSGRGLQLLQVVGGGPPGRQAGGHRSRWPKIATPQGASCSRATRLATAVRGGRGSQLHITHKVGRDTELAATVRGGRGSQHRLPADPRADRRAGGRRPHGRGSQLHDGDLVSSRHRIGGHQ